VAKAARAFQMPEGDREELPVVQTPQADPAMEITGGGTSTSALAATVLASRPAYREGRKNLSVWLDATAFNTFKAMVSQDGEKMSDYVIDMINREFARKGLPQIAKK